MNTLESTPVLNGEAAEIVAQSLTRHVADVVDMLNGQSEAVAVSVLATIPIPRAAEILDYPGLDRRSELIGRLPLEQASGIISGMSADRVADLFRHLPEPPREALLARMEPETRVSLGHLLAYPKDSAGSIMTTEFVSVPETFTVAQTLAHLRSVERTRETVYAIYILDSRSKNLLQAISLRGVISAQPEQLIIAAAPHRNPITVTPSTDREEVARLISKYDLLAVPVIENGKVVGIVTVDDIIDAIVEESTEDVQKFGGMEALDEPYGEISFLKMIKKRAGWLSVLFLSEMLTASAMQGFQSELEKAVVLTLFIPLIMSSGGNSGSQATSLLIRALALRELPLSAWWRVALKEIPMGLALGSILGAIGAIRIATWQMTGLYDYGEHWRLIALTVSAALIGIVTFGSLAGSMLPFALKRLGFDPASASAPFVATLVDVTGLVIYFSVALVILRGTLL